MLLKKTSSLLLRRAAAPALRRRVVTPAAFSGMARTAVVRSFSTMDSMESGTKMYMSLYPEGSSDGGE